MLGAPLLMRRALGAAIRDRASSALDPRQSRDGKRRPMIENDCVGLAFGAAANTRPIICRYSPIFFVGRARMQQPTSGMIPAFGEHHAVGNEFDFARLPAARASHRVRLWVSSRRCVRRARRTCTNSSRMWTEWRDVDGEADGLSAFAEFVPVGNDVADQLRAIHPLGELLFVIIAGDGADAFEIWINRRIDARADQIAFARSVRRPAGTRSSSRKFRRARGRRRGMALPLVRARSRSDRRR